MNIIVESLRVNGYLFKQLEEIKPKELGIRNKLEIYSAYDMKKQSYVILHVKQKSRVLQSNVSIFESIVQKVSKYVGVVMRHKIIKIDAPLCSKAKALLEKSGWQVIESVSI